MVLTFHVLLRAVCFNSASAHNKSMFRSHRNNVDVYNSYQKAKMPILVRRHLVEDHALSLQCGGLSVCRQDVFLADMCTPKDDAAF